MTLYLRFIISFICFCSFSFISPTVIFFLFFFSRGFAGANSSWRFNGQYFSLSSWISGGFVSFCFVSGGPHVRMNWSSFANSVPSFHSVWHLDRIRHTLDSPVMMATFPLFSFSFFLSLLAFVSVIIPFCLAKRCLQLSLSICHQNGRPCLSVVS